MRDARERLLRAATYGSLRDARETLCWYMSTQTPDPVTGEFELYHLQESIRAAIANNQPPLLSYLFFMRIGEPSFFVEDALRVRSTAVFRVLLYYGWDINKPRGRHLAPALGYVIDDGALTEWFLDKGADPNSTCEWGRTPMSNAMCGVSFVSIDMLFTRGADIIQGQLLHNAVLRDRPEHEVIELVELLLGKGATINEIQYENHPQTFAELQDFSLGTPLHYAAQAGKEMVVSYLLNKGADPLIRNTKGRTVIEAAGHASQSAVVEMLSHV
ncbi:hypothetical protein VC83_01471 [Pseudogymnoascus destructans]|uniref:Uncharacterized protein n=2 Tax=Pseudogymnoascus destructans TaxID=655981 RepID=L8FN84_PSED2|nr:uncharacterized protein VC83_01471 [Pseudogymnoascus destructans]ELR02004.1 hypothetical protein GMDG_05168 [Pseudogymnoascus destructans 20631-21]OAF62113.1 hypothetical protein VC83_01471 [Pseudogymnoascus destructans]